VPGSAIAFANKVAVFLLLFALKLCRSFSFHLLLAMRVLLLPPIILIEEQQDDDDEEEEANASRVAIIALFAILFVSL